MWSLEVPVLASYNKSLQRSCQSSSMKPLPPRINTTISVYDHFRVCVCMWDTVWQWRSKNDLSGSNCDSLLYNQKAEASCRTPQKMLHLNANLILPLHSTKKVYAVTVLKWSDLQFSLLDEKNPIDLHWRRDPSHMYMPEDHTDMKVQDYWTSDICVRTTRMLFRKYKNLV